MAEVFDLSGRPVSGAIPLETPLSTLKGLVEKIEAGEVILEKVFVIGEATSTVDKANVTHPTWDSGIMVSEAVFLVEIVKANLIEGLRQ